MKSWAPVSFPVFKNGVIFFFRFTKSKYNMFQFLVGFIKYDIHYGTGKWWVSELHLIEFYYNSHQFTDIQVNSTAISHYAKKLFFIFVFFPARLSVHLKCSLFSFIVSPLSFNYTNAQTKQLTNEWTVTKMSKKGIWREKKTFSNERAPLLHSSLVNWHPFVSRLIFFSL